MQKVNFSIFINAPREKVWDVMLGDETYRKWTKAFNEGAYYKGSWDEGSKILFLGMAKDGTGEEGMVSRIKENRLHEFMSIEHMGIVKDGVEDTDSDEAKKWAPSYENYIFKEKNGGTQLSVEMDVEEEYKSMMKEMWPKGLEIIKELSEKQ